MTVYGASALAVLAGFAYGLGAVVTAMIVVWNWRRRGVADAARSEFFAAWTGLLWPITLWPVAYNALFGDEDV